jgi:hypothetical protein
MNYLINGCNMKYDYRTSKFYGGRKSRRGSLRGGLKGLAILCAIAAQPIHTKPQSEPTEFEKRVVRISIVLLMAAILGASL